METSHLLVTLALSLGAAWCGALLAVMLRQSTILGFILGGLIIGPYTPGFVGDAVIVEELANVGVVLLMFAIGVHVSLRDLLRMGRVAGIGATVQMLVMLGAGTAVGLALGWDSVEALFFGAVMAISSGAVLSRVLEERGELDAVHGQIALAWSAVQDFATIVLVVTLSAVAEGGDNLAGELGWSLAKAGLFLALLIPIGSRVLPRVFELVASFNNREVFILTIAVVAIGTAYVSSLFGLSLALGAFAAGVVVSESDLSHQILGDIEPLRDIFAGLFFVSIGMLVDVGFVASHIPLLLLTVVLIVALKGGIITTLVAMFGYPLRTAITTGVIMSQAGEFSFLLARVGSDAGAVTDDIFSLMLAGSVVSIILTAPLLILAAPATRWVEARKLSRAFDVPIDDKANAMRGHAVLVGYGRVGSVIVDALHRRNFQFIVIEQDLRRVQQLREKHVHAVVGAADHAALLRHAQLEHARLLVIAIPDALATRRIVDQARQMNPRIEIVARTHSEPERLILQERGVSETVIGELELAIEMTRFTLHRFGVPSLEIQAMMRRLRQPNQDRTAE